MNDTLRKRIDESGLQKKFIAKKLKIQQSVLSMFLKGDRTLPGNKESQLREILEHQENSNKKLDTKVA